MNYEYMLKHVWKDNHPIKIGDILYSNFKVDENGYLLSLGSQTKDSHILGLCIIEPAFLPDGEVRFVSINCRSGVIDSNKRLK